ncbi:MAG: hypothetical protein ACFFF4_17855 [Candidatus Thorarchaeota archaeon]
MAEEWKNKMTHLIESLEELDDIRIRIKDAESSILKLTKRDEDDGSENQEAALVRLLEEVQLSIEEVELKTNQLDMKLSAIERLMQNDDSSL